MINCEYPQANAFVWRNESNVNNTLPQAMQQWIYNVNEMHKKTEKRPRNDIRRYFEC